jgi:hypothetical protein
MYTTVKIQSMSLIEVKVVLGKWLGIVGCSTGNLPMAEIDYAQPDETKRSD